MNEKGETFQKEKKKERKGEETFRKEKWKGKEWKHFRRRNRKERRGKDTFYREEGRKENKKGRKKLVGGLTVMRRVMGNSLSAILGAQLIGVSLVE